MRIDTRRVHEGATDQDGCRVLIDRLWPRGISKEAAHLDYWAKDIAPSHELRKWYQHDHEKWPEFRERYFADKRASYPPDCERKPGVEYRFRV